MIFSTRTQWDLKPNRIAKALENLRRSKEPFFDLTESNPTRCNFTYPAKEILPALSSPVNMSYIPSAQGLLCAREAVFAYYQRKNVSTDPQKIFLTASTSEAYAFLFRLLGNPGDAVLFPRPSYPLFQFLVDLNDLLMKTYYLNYTGEWRPDLQELSAQISDDVKAVVLVNPNNPTGSFFREDDLGKVKSLCRERCIPIICDEVFEDYIFDESRHFSTLVGNKDNLTFILGGLSKTLVLPQMKLSWIIVDGPEDLVKKATARLEVIADTYLSVNTPSQNALKDWLAIQPKIQNEVILRIRENRIVAEEMASLYPECMCLKADGGWYAVLKLPSFCKEEDFIVELIDQEKVFAHPGYFFDFKEEPYIVVSLLTPHEVFKEGLSRIMKRMQVFSQFRKV